MAKCKNITPTKKKLCLSAFRKKINLFRREILAPASAQSHRHDYEQFASPFAAIETKGKGVDIFDGVETSGENGIPVVASHVVTIKYRSDVTAENYVRFGANNYDILKAENIDERSEYLRLFCALKGDENKLAAL
ncbi:MAG: head-tail adaptor protein [Gammaproteobacteria bacterium]